MRTCSRITPESAPAAARRSLTTVAQHLGYVPSAAGRLASSPQLLQGFLKVSGLFEATTLDPVAREVVILTVAARNGCHLCVAMHTARLAALGVSPGLIAALRDRQPLADDRLEAMRLFTLAVIESNGAVGDEPLTAFLGHGYTARNALEVVLGIGAYTISTLANRMTKAPLDEQLTPFAWDDWPAAGVAAAGQSNR